MLSVPVLGFEEFNPYEITTNGRRYLTDCQWRTQEFCSGGVQQIQLRTEDRQNGDLGAVDP